MGYELEECRAGGYKARLDPEKFDEHAENIREEWDVDADTEHMLVWHVDGVKCSLLRSSGVLMVREEDEELAAGIVEKVLEG